MSAPEGGERVGAPSADATFGAPSADATFGVPSADASFGVSSADARLSAPPLGEQVCEPSAKYVLIAPPEVIVTSTPEAHLQMHPSSWMSIGPFDSRVHAQLALCTSIVGTVRDALRRGVARAPIMRQVLDILHRARS